MKELDFSEALGRLLADMRVARAGWNGNGMYLFYVDSWELKFPKSDLSTSPFIAMKTADNKVVPWLASQTDILATDWETVP